ncbi:MAG: putative glycoside hydrolase [Patescibacteria group bacterium]
MKRRLIRIFLLLLFILFYTSNSFATEKLIVLNFDDGPKPGVLLGEKGHIGLVELLESSFGKFIPAHFFVIGSEVQAHQKLIETLSKKGFFIENHTYGHDNLLKLKVGNNYNYILKTIQRTDSVIIKATGRYPKYFRPPYWAIDADLKEFINSEFHYSHKIVSLENPDINTLDYDDYAKKRTPSALIERVKKIILSRESRGEYRHVLVFHELSITVEALKVIIPYLSSRGYSFGTLDNFFNKKQRQAEYYEIKLVNLAENGSIKRSIKSAYLSIDNLYNQKKIEYIFSLFDGTELTAVVIDFKVGKPQINQYVRNLIARFHQKGIYVIGRLVMFQDSYLALARPRLAIRNKNGEMCFSGKKIWSRYWVDMASDEVLQYNIEIAKQGIDMGLDEINFDYIRFPSDLKNCNFKNNILYPVWDGGNKYQAMRQVFSALKSQLKNYAAKNNTRVTLSIDVFGEVSSYGSEPGIGQKLSDIAEFFDVISPMAYPSHYKCGEFGLSDPNANPYIVYKRTLEPGLKYLRSIGFIGEVRPWIQDFSITNIYGCGPTIYYGYQEVRAQIKASEDLGLTGFMLWNSANNYTKKALLR